MTRLLQTCTVDSVSQDCVKWIEISRSAIDHNVRLVREILLPHTYLMAVVKANAYGHGLLNMANAFLASGCDCLGVVSLEEAISLRNSGINAPIYVLSYVSPDRAEDVIRYNVIPVVFSLDFVVALDAASRRSRSVTALCIKVETGMNRHGLQGEDLAKVVEFVGQSDYLTLAGFSTHFACADDSDRQYTDRQIAIFDQTIEQYRQRGHVLSGCHAANSAGTLLYPSAQYSMVRCGIALYGLSPSTNVSTDIVPRQLKPVLCFKTRIVQIRHVNQGDTVSYGANWVAPQATTIAVLPVGYADGWRRDFSSKGHVLIRGQIVPILGRVCMNLCMVDISEVGGAAVGDEVTLISDDAASPQSAQHLAHDLGSIHYELVSRLAESIQRVMVN